jgi:SAM-dependent MidA family methyltransferase
MSDPDPSPPCRVIEEAKPYPSESLPATASLQELLHRQISITGPLRFTDFMASALYEPQLGYYARTSRQVGRRGDFFTSVSVGPLFGELLARRFLREWQESGSPSLWRIIECGAHDGTLAADILSALARLSPQALAGLEYVIPEPLPLLQATQRKTLSGFPKNTRFASSIAELAADPLPGSIFGNELLDALPFHIVEWHPDGWRECRVNADPSGNFIWENDHSIDNPKLLAALAPLGTDFPAGYRTEVRTHFADFLAPLTRGLSSGLFLWLDYGFARPEYYDPARKSGTLRTFSKHRAGDNPLTTPGEIDITAHVDFTALAETAIALGCQPRRFQNQGTWLTEIGREWLLSLEGQPQPAALHQFQTLTHPAHLGGCFHALELSWNQGHHEISASDSHRLALRACPAGESR